MGLGFEGGFYLEFVAKVQNVFFTVAYKVADLHEAQITPITPILGGFLGAFEYFTQFFICVEVFTIEVVNVLSLTRLNSLKLCFEGLDSTFGK